MTTAALPFPANQPKGYEWFDAEPEFDERVHLQLEAPEHTRSLKEFGYSDEVIATKASPVAVSSPFRILSEEGAAVLLSVARRLRQHATSCERIDNLVRGGCYRSRFLRDLCTNASLTQLMCDIYQTDVAPHTMPLQLGHMNFSPNDLSKAVDKWHYDTLPLDIVMMVTDPNKIAGGRFEYFVGTKEEMAELAKQGKTPPVSRVVAPEFNGAGYAIALHGNMVVHRGGPLEKAAERISMVNGYVSTLPNVDDQQRHSQLRAVDDPEVLYTEWAKHAAWRGRERLNSLLQEMDFTSDRKQIASQLKEAIEDVNLAIAEISDDNVASIDHFEK